MKKKNKMIEMLEKIVNIDSGSYDKAGVDRVGTYLAEVYKELGFKITTHEHSTLGNTLVLKHEEAKKPDILILAHMDTVFPKGTVASRPFSIEGNYAYGPGVIDMKASHVMLYYAICELINKKDESYKNIELIFNSDEEIGSESSRKIIESQAKNKKYTLVLEPARVDGSIVSARRGVGNYILEVTGKAAHAGIEPEKGRSSIQELALKIPNLHSLSDEKKNLNVNVGIIKGGTSVNTVAEKATAEIDVRISTVEQGEYIDQKIKEVCAEPEVEGTTLHLTGGINRPPMVFTKEVEQVVTLIQEEASKLNMNINHIATGGGSDASFTAALNIPTVDGLGPVGGKQHSDGEYLEIDSLVPRTELFMNVLSRLGSDCY